MPKIDRTEEYLSRLAALRRETDETMIRQELEAALAQKKSALVVAKAAELAAELGVEDLEPEMEGAFRRLLVDPLKRDKGCRGKTALVKALVDLERPASAVFLLGVGYVQMEPAWGEPVDVAAQLRGWCAHGLVRMRHAEAILEVTPLLVDPHRPSRLAAADALGDSGQVSAQAVLRLKVLSGDEEPEVIGECFNSLLRLDAQRSLDFVSSFLSSDDGPIAEGAALALGDSRLEEAIDLLCQQLGLTVKEEIQRSLYLALSLTRRDRAVEFLIEEVEEGSIGRARQALEALALHRYTDGVFDRLESVVADRRDGVLGEVWERQFLD